MSLPTLSDKKMPLNIKRLDGLLLLDLLKLLLILFYAHGKPLKLECKLPKMELSHKTLDLPSTNLKLKKDGVVYIKVSDHYGLDRFHTLSSNSSLSKPFPPHYTKKSSPEERVTTPKDNNYLSLSCQDTLQESSVPSSLTQPIPWSLNYTLLKPEDLY